MTQKETIMKKILVVTAIILVLTTVGCMSTSTDKGIERQLRTAGLENNVVWASNWGGDDDNFVKPAPEWTTLDVPAENSGRFQFIGLSKGFSTQQDAVGNARLNATTQIAEYLGQVVKSNKKMASAGISLSSMGLDPTSIAKKIIEQTAVAIVKSVRQLEQYTQKKEEYNSFNYYSWSRIIFDKATVKESFDRSLKDVIGETAKKNAAAVKQLEAYKEAIKIFSESTF